MTTGSYRGEMMHTFRRGGRIALLLITPLTHRRSIDRVRTPRAEGLDPQIDSLEAEWTYRLALKTTVKTL
jgi:hypothetical protein